MFEDREDMNLDPLRPKDRKTLERYGKQPTVGDRVRADTAGGSPVIDKEDIIAGLITASIIGGHALWGTTGGTAAASGGSAAAAETGAAAGGGGFASWASAGEAFAAEAGEASAPWWKSLLTRDNLKLAAVAAPAVIDGLHTSDAEEIEKEIFAARRERLADMRRHARGDFTPAERQRILDANEHIFDQIASNIASRGISRSGVGQQLLAMAYQQPFVREQQLASSMIDAYELGTWQMTRALMQEDEAIFDDVQSIFQLMLREDKEKSADPTLEAINESIKRVEDRIKILEQFE